MKRLVIFQAVFFLLASTVCLGFDFTFGLGLGKDPLLPIEERILAGDFNGARELFKNSFLKTPLEQQFRSKVSKEVPDVISYCEAVSRFTELANAGGDEDQAFSSFKTVERLYGRVPKSLHFSEGFVNKINETRRSSIEKYNTLVDSHNKKIRVAKEKRQKEIEEAEEAKRIAAELEATRRAEEEKLARERKIQREKEEREEEARWAREEAAERTRQKKAAAELAAKKASCGDDYGRIVVGMTLARVEQCVGKFTLYGQISREDGVVSQYQRGRIYMNVMDGIILTWGRY